MDAAQPQYDLIFERARLGILVLGEDCLVVDANAAICQLTGWTRAELVGCAACGELFLFGGEGASPCTAICQEHLQRVQTDPMATHRLLLSTKQGSAVPVMVSAAPVPLADGQNGLSLFVWDVSRAEEEERERERRRRQAEELVSLGREITAAADIRHQMGPVLDRARRLLEADLVAWGTLDEPAGCLTWEFAAGPGAHALRGGRMPLVGTLMGQILLQGRTYVTMNLSAEQVKAPAGRGLFASPALATALIIPLAVGDARQGALLCASRRRVALAEEDVMMATHLGSYLATALERALLLEEVRRLAILQERQRLAGEMHDGFAQNLTYLGLRLHLIGKYAARGDVDAISREVASLKGVLQEAHQEVRNAIYALKQSAPPSDPLALRWQHMLTDFADRTGIQVEYAAGPGTTEFVPQVVQSQLTRVLQEALANVRNHSGACRVTVSVAREEGELRIAIADDGCGFDPAAVQGLQQRHFGLTLMAERAAAVGAVLDLHSRRGHGTTVSIRWAYRLGGESNGPVEDANSVS